MPPDLSPISRKIREVGWRQGSLLKRTDHASALRTAVDYFPFGADAAVLLIVVNQICDLVGNPDIEPYVELICGRFVDRPNPLYQRGRNPRCIELRLLCAGETPRWIGISIHDRVRVRKEVFGDIAPDGNCILPDEEIHMLRRWLAKRYTRPAFPDAFNERLGTVAKRLEALWKSNSAHPVTGIYLQLPEVELAVEVPYDIRVRITAKAEAWEDPEQRVQLEEFEERFDKILEDCDGLVIANDDISTIPEEDLTLADLRNWKRLDVDYRSVPEAPGVEGPPDHADEI